MLHKTPAQVGPKSQALPRQCPQCGQAFTPRRKSQIHCTTRCRVRAFRARQYTGGAR